MSEKEEIIKTAVQIVIDPILKLIQEDPHQWSTRGCETCRTISSLLGKEFGCILYAKEMAERRKKTE